MQKVLVLAFAAALLAGHTQSQAQTRAGIRPAARATAKSPARHPAAPRPPAAARPTPLPVEAATSMLPPAKQLARPEPGAQVVSAKSVTDRSFRSGSNALNLGVGFGLGYGVGYGSNVSQTPALSLAYQRGVAEAGPGTISAGALVGYKSISWQDGRDQATWRNVYVGARTAYHYGFHNPRLDAYAGLGLGLRVTSFSDTYDAGSNLGSTASGSYLEFSSFVGARYFFSDKVGAFSELGYDMSYLKVGLSARF